ncbi:glycosyltransferase [Candidatus Planktophila dulcis]|uniref:glycosyltransferase n=1 Tax=Candidatus Planktophila dulcis TaxID=1884914 RepID=UPI003CF3B116
MTALRASIVVPALNEGEQIGVFLQRLEESVTLPVEVLIVVDTPSDTTLAGIEKYSSTQHQILGVVSEFPKGPANAIRYGISRSSCEVVVITMADGSDDPRVIDDLIRLIERGCAVAAASRYMAGGQQIGGPRFKKLLSRNASRALWLVLGVGTHDSTNSFKAYSKNFIDQVGIESDKGFELGLELVAKAHRSGRMIAEVPTIWIDRMVGESNFQLRRWLPQYLRWFFYAFGSKLTK